MANSRGDLTRPEELVSESDVNRVGGEIEDGTVPADVENGIVVLDVDVAQLLGRSEFGLDGLVLEKLDGFVVFEHLLHEAESK